MVFGGTGTVGTPLVKVLCERGADACVVTRSAEKAENLPDGAKGFVADLEKPESLAPALKQADAVFLLVANGPPENHQGLTALSMIMDAGTKRLVYLSSDLSARAPSIPHAGSKVGIEAAIVSCEIDWTILRPTLFAQTDLWIKDALLAGSFAVPLGDHPVARIDACDVADAAATALLEDRALRRVVALSALEAPNGPQTAELWQRYLGHPVVYPPQSIDAWMKAMSGVLPPWLIFDLACMYREFAKRGHPLDPTKLNEQGELLPNGTRSYAAFVEECARAWRREALRT